MDKLVFKSKTFWFGILTALAPAIPAIREQIIESPQVFAMIWGGLSVALRFITKGKVKLSA